MSIEDTLKARAVTHGSFRQHAAIAQGLKEEMVQTSGWTKLTLVQKESLEMIAHKIARILNGSPDHEDHWHDIQGYAALVEQALQEEKTKELNPGAKQARPTHNAILENS